MKAKKGEYILNGTDTTPFVPPDIAMLHSTCDMRAYFLMTDARNLPQDEVSDAYRKRIQARGGVYFHET